MERQHRSLYRKYRPQAPGQIIGQEHVVRALTGAVADNRLAHAFLFCGPRGTGKTSTARILAKMVNCVRGPTAEPCDVCEQCVRIREGQHLDVVEIDAASHGGVEDARELRERAPTAPAQGREKVYIIDEAQRLSREAFDALLKVFEEPPPGVRFVLATTEPHKMPPTIVGRCQRFDFRRVSGDALARHLRGVATDEGLTLSEDAAAAIARHSEGSVRDALSLLDQAAVLGARTVDADAVSALVGAADLEGRFEIADAVASQDARAVFEIVNRLVEEGRDIRNVTAQAIAHFRDLLLALVAPEQRDLVDVPPEHHTRLVAQGSKFTVAELDRILEVLLEANLNLRWTTSPRLTLELALVKAAVPETDARPEAVLGRVERLERLAGLDPRGGGVVGATAARGARTPAPQASPRPTPAPRTSGPDPTVGRPSPARVAEEPPTDAAVAPAARDETPPATPSAPDGDASAPAAAAVPASPQPTAVDGDLIRRSWGDVVKKLDSAPNRVLHTLVQLVVAQSLEGDTLELVLPAAKRFAADKIQQKQQDLQEVLRELFGIAPAIRCVVRDGPAVSEPDLDDEEPPPTPEVAALRVMEGLGAEVVED